MAIANLISDAEWQIMRLIWATVPTTSSDVCKALSDSTGWTSTTVKTLLARLVKKKAISFELNGRTRQYFPLISEEECIKEEMRSVIDKFYGGYANLETEHFIFRGDNDLKYIMLLAEVLEGSFTRITSDLDYDLKEKQLVYTHVTQKRLHSALGALNGPNWLRGGYTWGILHIAPQNCFNDITAEGVAIHTFSQIIINQINPSAPYWLQQAVSSYEGKWLSKERIAEAVKSYTLTTNLSEMREMTKTYITFKEISGYELSYTVAEYIVADYGMAALAKLLRAPSDFVGILNVSENLFWENWRAFLSKCYL